MAIRVAINGFGRIGRHVFKIMQKHPDIKVLAINDLTDTKTLAHLLKYDTIYGRFDGTVEARATSIVVNGTEIPISAEKDPTKLPWQKYEVDCVIESTGKLTTREQLDQHLKAGAKKVVLTAPPKDKVDMIIVMGVNDKQYKPEYKIISNASCTTNCLAPVAKVLNDTFGIARGLMTTIHAYTNDQRVTDLVHDDLRRARAAAQNIIPTTTGAAKAVGEVLPELKGKLNGYAVRVPVITGSLVDLTVDLKKNATVEEINKAMKAAAEGPMKGYLKYTEDPIVSSDVIRDTASSVFDSLATMVIDGNQAKVLSWYDNEWGYSCRVVDLVEVAMK